MVGTQLIGLEVSDSAGNKKLLKMMDIHELIRRELIQGCSLIEDNGQTYIKSTQNKIASLPLINRENGLNGMKFTVTGRVYSNGALIGYTATDESGKLYRLSKDKVWDIARYGGFTNVSASVCGNKKVLRGLGIRLRDLPEIQV
jgi:hypothetical protein